MFKPNPSLVGKSRFSHSPIWLALEREILEWWETARQELRIPIPVNLNDSILLIYEKEVLEWWHSARKDLGYSQEEPIGAGLGVWNTPLHQQYETELAEWWKQEFRESIYNESTKEKMRNLFLSLPSLHAFWPTSEFIPVTLNLLDESENSFTLEPINFNQLSISQLVTGISFASRNGISGWTRPLELGTEQITFGGWFRVNSGVGSLMHRGEIDGGVSDSSYAIGNDDANSFFCRFIDTDIQTHKLTLPAQTDNWNFLVARYSRDNLFKLTVNNTTTSANAPNKATYDAAHQLFLLRGMGASAAHADTSLIFTLDNHYLSDSWVNLLYVSTKDLFI